MNLDLNASTMVVLSDFATLSREEYHFTPVNGDVHSKGVILNGIELEVDDNGDLPPLLPMTLDGNSSVTMGPRWVAFVVVASAKTKVCF